MPDSRAPSVVESSAGDVFAPEEVVGALIAILDSDAFGAAPRSRDFLSYIVTEHLAGRGDRLGEHAIARHALGRPEYDARLNSSVRVQATRLRAALQRYYDDEGAGADLRISLPAGSYVPAIERRQPTGAGTPVADDVAVAVLHFHTSGSGAALIGATVCDAIVSRLTAFPGLRVVGPAAVAPTDLAAAARLLGARFTLQGRITVVDGAVGLEAELSDAESGDVVWSVAECLASSDLDESRLDDRWAAAVAGQVGDSTGIIFRRAVAQEEGSGSVVYAARLAYTDFLMQGTVASISAAAIALDRALEAGPSAELLAMRGSLHNAEVNQGTAPRGREGELRSAEALARQALALDPQCAAAHLVLGGTAWQRQEWDVAHECAAEAVRLAPAHPTVLMSAGTVMAVAGDWEGGVRTLRRGFRLNPGHPGSAHAICALAALMAGDDAGALAEASLIHAPGQVWGPLYRALALAALGFSDQAWSEMSQVLEIDPSFLDDPGAYFRGRANFRPHELDVLLAHFEPFAGGPSTW